MKAAPPNLQVIGRLTWALLMFAMGWALLDEIERMAGELTAMAVAGVGIISIVLFLRWVR